jgi:hypothetical protein
LFVVDNFGVKYTRQEHAEHLKASLEDICKVSTDWNGCMYYGIIIEWDRKNRTVDLSMHGYTMTLSPSTTTQNPPHLTMPHRPGILQCVEKNTKDAATGSTRTFTTKSKSQWSSTFLFDARSMDLTLISPLNIMVLGHSKATATKLDAVINISHYCAAYPDTKLRYHPSGMTLHIHNDASYLSEKEAKSRAGGCFTLVAS